MALLWEKRAGGVCYQVRTAGNTVRLYTNGVLHTQYNPTRLLTGSVWDLLLLGALFVPRERMRRVLLLGVGGGCDDDCVHRETGSLGWGRSYFTAACGSSRLSAWGKSRVRWRVPSVMVTTPVR